MKNKVIVTACTLLAMATASAQNAYDAEKLLGNDLNGTARFVGMGGAMGALGGDISVMSSNKRSGPMNYTCGNYCRN